MPRAHRNSETRVAFRCPGCNSAHMIDHGPGGWTFNGDFERPTFAPSVLIRTGHHLPGHTGSCWCTYNAENPDNPAPFACIVCHSFVRDGAIQFLSDCTHALAGQTVDLPEWGAS
jgi:Family of unknown function (DUF6527)